ncbi:cytochrome P450 [Sphingomonas sp. ID0503]|uniref:cytochrome P450 n=1 Tax=Sphingomonas sp. ID0503 TaxID=3399691 RepID=UPI003AFA503A
MTEASTPAIAGTSGGEPFPLVDFFSADILASPHDFLQKSRTSGGIVEIRTSPSQRIQYLVTRYDLVKHVLLNPQLFSSNYQDILTSGGRADPEVEEIRAQGFEEVSSVLTADDADHRRLRTLISDAFSPARLRAMSEALEQVVHDRIDGFIEQGRCDFMHDFADWLPSAALASMMGLDGKRNGEIQAWALAITRRFGGMGELSQRVADERAILDAKRFMEELVEDRRRRPGDDLVSDLLRARLDGDRLSELEIYATIFILLVGATETTFNTLNFAMLHLVEYPELRDRLRQDPPLVSAFVDEVLRYYTPVAGVWRIVREDLELGGVSLSKGTLLMVRFDAANRDPAQFEQPEDFDIFRKNNSRHLSFSLGPHTCIGFRLAKQELTIAIPALIDRLYDLKVDRERSDLSLVPAAHARGLTSLHLTFTPGSRLK